MSIIDKEIHAFLNDKFDHNPGTQPSSRVKLFFKSDVL